MIAELLVGGGIGIAGLVIGHFEGYLMGVKVRNVSQLGLRPELESGSTQPCLCGHGVTTHREHGAGSCSAFDPVAAGAAPIACACKFYVANPEPPASPRNALQL